MIAGTDKERLWVVSILHLKSGKGVEPKGPGSPLQTTFPFAGLKIEIFLTVE